MLKCPSIFKCSSKWLEMTMESHKKCADGRYVPARPLPRDGLTDRLRATWLVFVGKADAMTWEDQ